jgi:hypothetical protein
MARWFTKDCSPCKPLLKSISATLPWLGVFGNADGNSGTAVQTATGKWPAPIAGNCIRDRYSAWHIKFGVIPGSPLSAGGGKFSSVRIRDVYGLVNAYVAGVDPTYTERVVETIYEIDAGVMNPIVTSDTTRTGTLATWSLPAGLSPTAGPLAPQSFRIWKITDGVITIDLNVETSITFSGNVQCPAGQALAQASLQALKALDWGQHSVNGVVSTFSDPTTIPTYIFSQALNASSYQSQASGHSGGQSIFWTARRVAVLFPWPDMDGCVVTAQTINPLTSVEGSLACVDPMPNNATGCAVCYGGCSSITTESIDDAIDPIDDPIIYLEPPDFGQQYLVVKSVSCPDAIITRTTTLPCNCCDIVCQ